MGFVNSYKADLQREQVVRKKTGLQPLRGYIKKFTITARSQLKRVDDFLTAHTAVQGKGRDVLPAETVGLILHQGDERAHHKTQTGKGHGRHLETH